MVDSALVLEPLSEFASGESPGDRAGPDNRAERREAKHMRVQAILRRKCPRCLRGSVFEAAFRMKENCGVCRLRFDRHEPGYFLGAMYFAYGLALAVGSPPALYFWWRGFSLWVLVAVLALELTLLSPWIFQYSRILFLHLDQGFDPAPVDSGPQ